MRPARERVELLQFFFRVAMPGFSVNYGRSFGSVCRAEDQDREHGSEHLPILLEPKLKKAEAISIACARGLYVGRPDDPTVGMTSENAWTGGKIPPDLTCTSCTGPRTGPLPPRR